jgi:HTH-type transcriptional regulator/antitoxin HigA
MITTTKIDEKKYIKLLVETVPRIPENDVEYEKLLSKTEELMAIDEEKLSVEQNKLLQLLSVLVDQYEQKNYPIADAEPIEVLRHLMQEHSLKQKDISALLGSKGVVSEVLNRKRSISKAQAKILASFFKVPAAVFI